MCCFVPNISYGSLSQNFKFILIRILLKFPCLCHCCSAPLYQLSVRLSVIILVTVFEGSSNRSLFMIMSLTFFLPPDLRLCLVLVCIVKDSDYCPKPCFIYLHFDYCLTDSGSVLSPLPDLIGTVSLTIEPWTADDPSKVCIHSLRSESEYVYTSFWLIHNFNNFNALANSSFG